MNTLSWLVCRSFIESKRKEAKEELLSFLDPKRTKEILSLPSLATDLSLGFDQVRQMLDFVHPSWFAPFLRTLPEHEIPLFLAAFPENQKNELCKLLLCTPKQIELPSIAKNFLQRKIVDALLEKQLNLFPIEALPISSLLPLLKLSSQGLHLLIDFLGLYDLSTEMRLIIDKVRVKKMESALSKEQIFFLSSLLGKQDPQPFKPIGLQAWNGTSAEFLALLHKRGMNRFSKALYPENKDFISYITFRMPVEEANLFSSLHKKLEPSKILSYLVKQILEVLAFFEKNKLRVFS